MAEQIKLNQQDFKELLGKFYNEDANYSLDIVAYDDTYAASNPALKIEVEDLDYIVEPGEITTAVKLYVNASDFVDELNTWDKIYHQPIEKIQSLSIYDKLIKEYGFKDEDYLDGNFEALNNYLFDHDEETDFHLSVTVKENFKLTAPEVFDDPSYINIYEASYQVLNASERVTPNIINELGLSGQLVEEESRMLDDYFNIEFNEEKRAYVDVDMKIDS